jgi:transcriptional regulator with XRE-family HTH domain
MPFDAWLSAELDQLDMTLARLARLSGLHRSTISRLLHAERRPTVETAARIAVALGSTRPRAGPERRTDIVARVRHELAADPTLRPRDVQRVMTHYVLQRAARRTSFRE